MIIITHELVAVTTVVMAVLSFSTRFVVLERFVLSLLQPLVLSFISFVIWIRLVG